MEMHFAFCFDGKVAGELRKIGVPVHILGPVRLSRPWSLVRGRRALSKLVKSIGFDAVICHHSWAQGLLGSVARKKGIPDVLWLHDPPLNPRLHWTEKLAKATTPSLAICNSKFTQGFLGRLYPHVASEVIYCPVSPPDQSVTDAQRDEVRRGFGADTSTTVILQTGRWERHKGHLLHLDALKHLGAERNWMCWFVGGAQRPHEVRYMEEVKAKAKALGLQLNVRFLGWQPNARMLFDCADIYCQPNAAAEPFGITFIEAMYAGLPVVTTARGGPLEIVDDTSGILVPPEDPSALGKALGSLMDDKIRLRGYRDAGPRRARQLCEPGHAMNQLYSTLRQFIGESELHAQKSQAMPHEEASLTHVVP